MDVVEADAHIRPLGTDRIGTLHPIRMTEVAERRSAALGAEHFGLACHSERSIEDAESKNPFLLLVRWEYWGNGSFGSTPPYFRGMLAPGKH